MIDDRQPGARVDPARQRDWAARLARRVVALTLVLAITAAARTSVPPSGAQGTPPGPADKVAELTELVTRHGVTADGIEVDLILATPGFFQLTGRWQEALDLGADRSVVIVFTIHHHGALPDDETIVPILQLDGRSYHVPAEVRHLAGDGHHRSDALLFGDLPVTLLAEAHTLDALLPPGPDGMRPTFRWFTPIDEPAMMPMPHASPMATPAHDASMVIPTPTALEAPLTRHGQTGDGTDVDVLLTPFEFFRAADRMAEGESYGADRVVVMLASEHHYHGAPPLAPVLRVDGDREFAADRRSRPERGRPPSPHQCADLRQSAGERAGRGAHPGAGAAPEDRWEPGHAQLAGTAP